ncbi:MAG: two-component regulator propeller domain-containing protein [Chitinophagales bacterium]
MRAPEGARPRALNRLWWLLILSCHGLMGQHAGGVFYQLTTRNGLSSNRSTAVIQDHKGYYWIATEDGLNRFDGTSCKIYRSVKDDNNSLSNNSCNYLLEDAQENIWIGTQEGISIYNSREGKFKRVYFHHPTISFEHLNSIRGIAKDDRDNIYMCSYGLWQYNTRTGKWRNYFHDSTNPASLPAGLVFSPVYDSLNKGLWMKSSSGFVFFDRDAGKFYHKSYNPKALLLLKEDCDDSRMVMDHNNQLWFFDPQSFFLESYSVASNRINVSAYRTNGSISDISTDDENRIWIHYWNRATAIYSPDKKTTDSTFLQFYHQKSALSRMACSVYTDKNRIYWICSKKGVSIFNARAQAVNYYTIDMESQPADDSHIGITCLAEEDERFLWIGTNLGMYRFNFSSKRLIKVKDPFETDHYIRCLYLQADSILWIGGQSALARYDIKNEKMIQYTPFLSPIQSIYPGPEDQVWIGTWINGLYKLSSSGKLLQHLEKGPDPAKSLFSNYLLCISGGKHEPYFWLGYNGGNGYSKVSANSESFQHFKIETRNDHKISNSVNCITEDKDGDLWIGTFGSGLFRFSARSQTYSGFDQTEGLSGDYINALYADDSARIWISTCNGLDILDTRTHTVLNTGIDLEQSSNDLVANCLVRKNKKLLFFARNRIVEVSPVSFLQPAFPSTLLLNSFKIFDKEIFLPDTANKQTVRLSYRQNFFSFEYSLLKPDPEGYVQYAYLLEGFDPDWNEVRYRHFANYTNVPPGHYTLRIKAADLTGSWTYFSKPVDIIISPPFWIEWWFIVLVCTLTIALVYAFFKWRISQVRKVYDLRSDISKDLHDQIGATLTSISLLSEVAKIERNSEDQDSTVLNKIGAYSREMIAEMNDIVWAINPLNDSFDKIIDRMQNFAMPFLASKYIQFSFQCEEKAKEVSLNMKQRKNLYLIFKESLNNAAKYSRCTEVNVSLKQAGLILRMEIRDNGVGFGSSVEGSGNGMRNMRQRAMEMNGKLELNPEQGKGTHIVLEFPITQNAH